MRTRQQEKYRYNGITPREFGERTGQSAAQVRELIGCGWFAFTEDGTPECLDVSSPGTKQRTYKIHPSAVQRFYKERGVSGRSAA